MISGLQMWMRIPKTVIQQVPPTLMVIFEELRLGQWMQETATCYILKVDKEIGFGPR